MHPSSFENMRRCRIWYAPPRVERLVEIGSANVNGTYRNLFANCAHYVGVDMAAGPGVDVVLEDPYVLPFPDHSTDLVISGQMLEHCPQFWRVFTEIARILKPDGLLFMIAPSTGPIHRYPVDCWRDERGPWQDLVGVFQKGDKLTKIAGPKPPPPAPAPVKWKAPPEAEATKGARSYLDTLADLHRLVAPKLYLEIGVRKGRSLSLTRCKAIAVDPYPELTSRPDDLDLHTVSSDDFFFFHAKGAITQPVDLAFIDGMHFAEFVYRDFMYLEPYMSSQGLIVIDDVLPNHSLQAARNRQTAYWCGDVWRFAEGLATLRPDLKLTWLDTSPTGLLVVSQLKSANRALFEHYNTSVNRLFNAPVPPAVLNRERAVAPSEEVLRAALHPPR